MSNKPEKRVLIIDDDPAIRQMLRVLLRAAKYTVVGELGDGYNVKEELSINFPDIVLLDISMPGVNGLDVLEEIKQTFPQVQVVMISGSSSSEDVHTAVKRGAVGYIVKPFNTAKVIENIERATGGSIQARLG